MFLKICLILASNVIKKILNLIFMYFYKLWKFIYLILATSELIFMILLFWLYVYDSVEKHVY